MTYCLGIMTKQGLVMASDSRTNAGYDQVNSTRKMYHFAKPGERAFTLLASGSLSCTQSTVTLLQKDFDAGAGLASCETLYDAARVVGNAMRAIADIDKEALEKDDYKFNVHIILGGQIRNQPHGLYLLYPQGNPLKATEDAPFLQIGEIKYGKPILDRGIQYDRTTLEDAAKLALLSMDSTMKSNVTVGPPVDLLAYCSGDLDIRNHRRFTAEDPDLGKIRARWEAALRGAMSKLPSIRFTSADKPSPGTPNRGIELVEGSSTPDNPQSDQSPPKR